MSPVTGSFRSRRHVSVIVFPCMAASVRVNVELGVCQAARLICARVAGGTCVSVLMVGALCLAISEMRDETKYRNPTFYSALLFSML